MGVDLHQGGRKSFTSIATHSIKLADNEYQFTAREMDCIYYLRQGYSAKMAARFLRISPRTVEHYLVAIRNKLGCHSKSQILEYLGDSVAFYQPN